MSGKYVFESDANAIKALVREMVTQSILPFMETRIMTWNDQVASRRRGISGRFMSLSKRWAGFGSKATGAGSSTTPNSPAGNYDHRRGFYLPETPEATMRQLGDYAFMLRDWRLASNTYDLLRTDFNHDKAWNYYAAANEMAAITALLNSQAHSAKSKLESIDQMLDTAAYSYLTRCSLPMNVVRCLTSALELLMERGHFAVDDATHWGGKLLELNVLTPVAQTLISERMADCYGSQLPDKTISQGSRKRQSALWNLLASESWLRLKMSAQAHSRLTAAKTLYGLDVNTEMGSDTTIRHPLWMHMETSLRSEGQSDASTLIDMEYNEDIAEIAPPETVEHLGIFTQAPQAEDVDQEGFTQQGAGSGMHHTLENNLMS